VFVLTARGDIVRANAAGEAMLAAASVVRNLDGRLELADAMTNRDPCAALAAVGEDGDVALSGKRSSMPLRGDHGGEFVVHIMPLNQLRQQWIDADPNAAMIVFVTQPDSDDAQRAFTERFGLTPKETGVLKAVVEVGGVPMAKILGISPATVRTHVTSIFDKSGVRRQADLIRLLMQMKSPFIALKRSRVVAPPTIV
jgi:hypothetical protein